MSISKKNIPENIVNLTDRGSYVNARLPWAFVLLVIAICVMPFLLNLIGVDFGTEKHDPNASLSSHELQVISLRGAFEHTILEWTGFCIALCTAFLALSSRHLTTQLIGTALFFAGCMDAFHTLATDYLIETVADNHNMFPFTWAICRLFDALIMIVVLGFFLVKGVNKLDANLKVVVSVSFLFGLLAYAIIHLSATSVTLPQTMYPDALMTRPYDVAPLFLFIFAGLVVYPAFHKRYPSLFSHALLISVIPEIATQLYMVFGSTALFDNYFNIAHFLKMMTYLVPFVGLSLDYARTNVTLQEAYQFNKTILTVAPLGIASYRSDGQCVSANETIGTMIGTEQMLSQNFRQIEFFKNATLLADAEETLSTGVDKKREVHVTFGKVLYIECYLSRFIINDEFHLLLMIHDITNRKQAEKACQVGDGLSTAIYKNKAFSCLLGRVEKDDFYGETEFLTSSLRKLERDYLSAKTFPFFSPMLALMVMTDGVSDDYFPPDKGMLHLFGDLVLNGIIPVVPSALTKEQMKLLKQKKDEYMFVEKRLTENGAIPTPICSVSEYAKILNLSIEELIATPALLAAGVPPEIKQCDSTPESRLQIWLDSYHVRGSFDDRSLVVVF
ncbi:conserved hypothetical protein, membrane [Candidatus Thiomargarita nelsonii]|uniref:PAS domain-containing protein n=1 Tax=Candidatus Thiomargarita nelsonii TaxID=1003181 RepID=A0A176S0F5_9GAMM|nr:conserved hypothetical protein, membrane [Candidatus Thiomargarita nelsonii]